MEGRSVWILINELTKNEKKKWSAHTKGKVPVTRHCSKSIVGTSPLRAIFFLLTMYSKTDQNLVRTTVLLATHSNWFCIEKTSPSNLLLKPVL